MPQRTTLAHRLLQFLAMSQLHRFTLFAPLLLLATVGAHATQVRTTGSWDNQDGLPLQNLNDYFARWGVDLDVNSDQLVGDELWNDKITSGSTALLVLEVAGYAPHNNFGIFEVNDANEIINRYELFSGDNEAGATMEFMVPSGRFGFYLEYEVDGRFFYSDPQHNADPAGDQMVAYWGGELPAATTLTNTGLDADPVFDSNTYILAWEDLPYHAGPTGTDNDFNDMVVMIRVQSVPDGGATLILLGVGLAGLVSVRRMLSK